MAMIGKIKIRPLSKIEMKATPRLFINLTFKEKMHMVYYMQVVSSYMLVVSTKYRGFLGIFTLPENINLCCIN